VSCGKDCAEEMGDPEGGGFGWGMGRGKGKKYDPLRQGKNPRRGGVGNTLRSRSEEGRRGPYDSGGTGTEERGSPRKGTLKLGERLLERGRKKKRGQGIEGEG